MNKNYHVRVFTLDSDGLHAGEYVHPGDNDLTLDDYLALEKEAGFYLKNMAALPDKLGHLLRVVTQTRARDGKCDTEYLE